jgi:alpha-beta hydrolase superfamily lysophospholipase
VPTLILAGAKDAIVPEDALARTADLLPRGKLVVWPDVGHSPQVESPDAFVRLLASRRSLLDRARTWLWRAGRRLSGAPPPLAGGSSKTSGRPERGEA